MEINLSSQEIEKWSKFIMIYKFAIEEMNTKLKILNEEFTYTHQHNPIEHLKYRVKEPHSIIQKLSRKGFEVSIDSARENIYDIAGMRVVCPFNSDIYTIYEMLKQQTDIKIFEVRDYIKNPKPNGYTSFHLIVEIPIFLSQGMEYVKVEIQIRTIAMDFWASLEHKIFYKYNKEVPRRLVMELKKAADSIYELDHKMENIHNEVREIKDKNPGDEELERSFIGNMF